MKTAKLGEIATFVRGVTFKPADVTDDGVGLMRTKNVQETLDLTDVIRIPAKLIKKESQYLQPGDALISSANSWNLVGKACWVGALSEPLAIGGFVTALRPDKSQIEPRYLYRWITSPRTQAVLRSFSNKTTSISNLNLKLAAQMSVPVPPRAEQRRIAGILDQADSVRAERRQVLAHLDILTQSIFYDMFGNCTMMAMLGEVISEGPTNGLYRPASDYGSGTPILRIDGFDSGIIKAGPWKRVRISISERERYSLAVGDIVINRVNALSHLGKATLIEHLDEPSVYESNMMRIRLDTARVAPRFALAWLQSTAAKRQILKKAKKAINQASVNQGDIRSLSMPLPPRDVQTTFTQRAERVNAERAAVRRALDADNELYASLQARAFRGEL